MNAGLLEVRDLRKYFQIRTPWLRRSHSVLKAVDGVSFDVQNGETVAIVGESGCGKTTLARCILRLIDPTAGEIRFEGQDLVPLSYQDLKPVRRRLQMIFQDPYGSMNPRMKISAIIEEPLIIYRTGNNKERKNRVAQLLELVGLHPGMGSRYPHELSGGQKQRIGIARALALSPRLIVADEPVSALDIPVQTQIINLLIDLREKLHLAFVFIAHDLNLVQHCSDRICVMYLGTIVEQAPASDLFRVPLHPYTKLLKECIPVPDPGARRKRQIPDSDQPGFLKLPPGCKFHPRCPIAVQRCYSEEPLLRDKGNGRSVACHLAE